MDQTVTLSEREWQQVVNAIANQPWHLANPLLMKMGEQLRTTTHPGYDIGGKHYGTAEEARKALDEAHGKSTNSGEKPL